MLSLNSFLAIFFLFSVLEAPALAIKKSYVVYLGGHSHGPQVTDADLDRVTESHTRLLAPFVGSQESAKDAIFYSYKRHVNGFAALLDQEVAAQIAKHPDVVSVFPNQMKKLHTTHSWKFLGVENNGSVPSLSVWKKAQYGKDTIIANIDSGVWPESKSFSGKGYGPIPSRWKGSCHFEKQSLCNRKLIGARYFNKGYAALLGKKLINATYYTPRDGIGHGTHTLSIAGGNFVPGANVFGVGKGTAKGGAPQARVATYRVCYEGGCAEADIIQAIDTAIEDGVDVVSVSLGSYIPANYLSDSIAISSFHAVKKGIVVVASAGNFGPDDGSVRNTAPWIITVGASSIDRKFQSNVKLANGIVLEGVSMSRSMAQGKYYPLISGAAAKLSNASEFDSTLCDDDTLDPTKVKGKIVVCVGAVGAEPSSYARSIGAAGVVLCNDETSGNTVTAEPHVIPATNINVTACNILLNYVENSTNPKGTLTPVVERLNVHPAPYVPAFSSRGPSPLSPEILKPDIIAPGFEILASYSENVSPTAFAADKRRTPFIVLSGTSMSCPHVSGIIGLLKRLHPDWTPAALRSAIMTTATTGDNTGSPIKDVDLVETNYLAHGSGHIHPNRAVDPGLVYDLTEKDYLDFLCGAGYNQTLISQISDKPHDCPKNYSLLNFNNPALMVPVLYGRVSLTRSVKNVGKPGTYVAQLDITDGVSVSVEPRVLKFERIGEEKTFKVTFTSYGGKPYYATGHLTWSDGSHSVRSPVIVGVGTPHTPLLK